MIQNLSSEEVRKFILDNEGADLFSLPLKYKEVAGVDISIIINQLKGKLVAKKKLPLWYANSDIIYPAKISMEQCSSQRTAEYKSALASGKTMIDLTGGAGVDLYFLSRNFESAKYIERNKDLYDVAHHNFIALKAKNIDCHCTTSESFLAASSNKVDLIYLDPARRADTGKKLYRLDDCEPNVVKLMPELLNRSRRVIIKASPMLDIAQAITDLKSVKEVHVVSVENECKELLFVLEESTNEEIIHTVNLKKGDKREYYQFKREDESITEIKEYSRPLAYLFEPNASILKAGAFKSIAKKFNLLKLHPNTHLYTQNNPIQNFPGRTFKVEQCVKFNKKSLIKALPDKKANLATRNFPDDVAQIKKRTGIKDGGEFYLFATTVVKDEKLIIITKKLETK